MKRIRPCQVVPPLLAVVCAAANVSNAAETAAVPTEPPSARGDVVVSATQVPENSFDLPASIDSVGRARIQDQQPQVNLSESLGPVPGIVVNNRQNYAQDLQVSSRGFGARATFGVRGIQLFADGIPATMPDGQGQAATFSLSSAERIEVLRGPFAYLYGNASGGVIQVFTEDGPKEGAMVRTSFLTGSYDTQRVGVVAGGQAGRLNYIVDDSHFRTDGYRDHSAASRDHVNAKLKYDAGPDTKVTLVTNYFDQPDARDPLGLDSTQVAADPRQAGTNATLFNTRKGVRQNQAGVVLEHRFSARDSFQLVPYFGERRVVQYLAFQTNGVVDLDRGYSGFRSFWTHKAGTADEPWTVTAGLDLGYMKDRRKGFDNDFGTAGVLRRNEDDIAETHDVMIQGEWRVAPRWTLNAGARYTQVAISVHDYFNTPSNGGFVTFTNSIPVAGVVFMITPTLNAYASVGKGFETPTLAELAYRPDGSAGLNFDLKPSQSTQEEVGLKSFIGLHSRLNVSLFNIGTRDEIVVATSVGGRTTYKNAPETRRTGLELSYERDLGAGFATSAAYTYLNAYFSDSYTNSTSFVAAGNRIPGVPLNVLHADVSWKNEPAGFSTTLEMHASSKVYVNDGNSATAAGYGILGWRAGLEQKRERWRVDEFVRIDNLLDKRYIGSVIVNAGAGRFYEPAPKRSFTVGLNARWDF